MMEAPAEAAPDGKVEEEKSKMKLKMLAEKVGVSLEEVEQNKYSKKYLKRLEKKKKWDEHKDERRKITKEKRKNKKKKPKTTDTPTVVTLMKDSPNKITLCIDLSFDSYMKEKEIRKLLKQIQRCYSVNRHFTEPCQFYLSSLCGAIKETVLQKQPGFASWDIHVAEDHFVEAFKARRENIVFLSSDSPNLLPKAEELKSSRDDKIYVIGGLVDHNFHKGLTLGLAEKAGIQHARLPIDQHVKLSMTKVLAVNHVFELMLLASTGVEWEEAFKQVIPARKFQNDSE